jgi:transposase-like protein
MSELTLEEKIKRLVKEHSKEFKTQEQISSISTMMMKNLLETALGAEMDEHLGYEKHSSEGYGTGNSRNGTTKKVLKGDFGEMDLETPRDRDGTFEPQLIKKRQTRMTGFDEQILSMYARGMTTRDIADSYQEMYGAEVSHNVVSKVTGAVIEEVKAWQNRPLDRLYPIIYFDCIVVKVHQDKRVINKSIYIALGIDIDGQKEVLGLWISENEGAKFWLSVLTELKNRGLEDVFIACVDGLSGFPDAINTVYPKTHVQLCIVHLIRNSLKYVSYKDRKAVAKDLKGIYTSPTSDAAFDEMARFAEKWDGKYGSISQMWHNHWDNIIPFLQYPPEIRKVIYTTNSIGTPGQAWSSQRVRFPPGQRWPQWYKR